MAAVGSKECNFNDENFPLRRKIVFANVFEFMFITSLKFASSFGAIK